MSDLLERWGRELQSGRAAFEPPVDRATLKARLDEVDRDIQDPPVAPSSPGKPRIRFLAWAAVLAILGGGWAAQTWLTVRPPRIGELSLDRGFAELRGPVETAFRSGEDVWIRFHLDRPGFAYVAMLDSRLVLEPVGAAVRPVEEGENRLGPFRLDEAAGTECFIVLVAERARPLEEIKDLIRSAAAAAAPLSPAHAERLPVILARLRRERGFAAAAVTFEHRPR